MKKKSCTQYTKAVCRVEPEQKGKGGKWERTIHDI